MKAYDGIRPDCPHCRSSNVAKHGRSKYGEAIWKCECGKHFTYKRREKSSKSGVIAAPVRIGRGLAGWH